MRLAFMGTPAFAVATLGAISAAGHDVAAVYTRAPAARGRGLAEQPSPVEAWARQAGVAVRTPATLRSSDEATAFRDLDLDLAVVVAYGLLLPPAILEAPRHGCLNLHASLLPRWRGAAPIHRAVMAGDRETGVAVMRMETGLDTGPVASVARLPIGPNDTTGDLHDRLAERGAHLMVEALAALADDRLAFSAQPDEGVSYARKIDKAEARIDWDQPAVAVHDTIRGLSPAPGAFFEADLGRGRERVKILRSEPGEGSGAPGTLLGTEAVACREGAVRLLVLQRAGRGPASAAEFWRGVPTRPDTVDLRGMAGAR